MYSAPAIRVSFESKRSHEGVRQRLKLVREHTPGRVWRRRVHGDMEANHENQVRCVD
jgi:hypothetical protein